MRASRAGHEKVVALLLSKEAEINAQQTSERPTTVTVTALTFACQRGHLEVVDLLIKAGADLELGDPNPMRSASIGGHQRIVKKLERWKKEEEKKNVVKAEDIQGYRGNTQDLDSLLQFIDGEDNKKKSKKASEKVAKKNTKLSSKSDVGKDKTKKSRDFEEKRTSASLPETVSAPTSNVSGHVSGGPSTISSTKETGKISPARSFNILE